MVHVRRLGCSGRKRVLVPPFLHSSWISFKPNRVNRYVGPTVSHDSPLDDLFFAGPVRALHAFEKSIVGVDFRAVQDIEVLHAGVPKHVDLNGPVLVEALRETIVVLLDRVPGPSNVFLSPLLTGDRALNRDVHAPGLGIYTSEQFVIIPRVK
jgi:hypothetical protein